MEFKLELKRLKELIKFTQLTLTNPLDSLELRRLCHTYGISTKGDWELIEEGVVQVLEQGMNAAKHSISYDDMVWLPIVLNIPIRGFNFLFIDEAQDLNQAQLALVLKAHKEGARGIFVGDPNQAIMGFAAADNKSIQNIIAQTNAITLPLSICYRCPLKHIELANKLYPVIESAPNAKEGTVKEIDISDIPRLVKSGDLIICRCFYPLILVYYNLLTRGIPVTVRKKDIGKELIGLLNQIAGEQSFTLNEFRDIANEWFEKQRHEMLTDGVSSITIANLEDRVNALKAVYKGAKCENTVQLKDAILELSQSTDNSVNLTTIHGSKGLEADVVFIIRTDLMPHPRAEQDWEKEQERNLMFVALTRAKKDLFFAN
jgi:superfamily I DNA/RNA helicase